MTSHRIALQPMRDARSDSAPRSASALPVQSISLRCVWERLSCPNRARCRRRGLGEREERLFFGKRRARGPLDLVSRASRSGLTSPEPFSLNGPAAPSAPPTFTSAAIVSLRMKRSWSCSTSFGPASGPDETPGRKITASSRRSIAGVGTDGAASASASQPSYLLAPGDPASVRGGELGRERARTAGTIQKYPRGVRYSSQGSLRNGRRHFGADDRSLAALSARLVSSFVGWSSPVARQAHNLEVVRSNRTPATSSDGALRGSGSGSSVLQIVAESEQRGNSGKPVRARRGLVKAGRHNDRQDAIRVSSGDGLGIHQPGSHTQGTRAKVQTLSGRAAEAANCPAVARFIQGRAA